MTTITLPRTQTERPESAASAITSGRDALADWQAAQPDNFFTADLHLQHTLEYHWGAARFASPSHAPRLAEFGGQAATVIDRLVRSSNLDPNLPRLDRYNDIGARTEDVTFHPDYHEAGRHIYGSGAMSVYEQPGNNLLSLALFYLSAQNGEAGHNCPLACTGGLIKVLQNVGSPELKAKYLPRLLDADYDTHFHGAQFLTEVQGGSDVGANDTVATPLDPAAGTWVLNGEKWFCSNVTADLALVTARVPGQGEGTKGLGLFLVPRRLDDGTLNNVFIRRLKDKLGTRSMPTAELDFRDALAYPVGPVESGFKNVMTYVINTSRIYNAVGVTGNARRACLVAATYAQHRAAFGQSILQFPLVQDILAKMHADTAAMLSGTFYLVHLLDAAELGSAAVGDADFLRLAINLNKYRTAVLAHEVILQGIELLGGNGAIETFSVLPRLLRDNVVYENWEGTHNVLLAQAQRDIRRYGIHTAFLARVRQLFEALPPGTLRARGLEHTADIAAELDALLAMDETSASVFFRPLMDRAADLYYAACLAAEAAWEASEKGNTGKTELAAFFFNRRVERREAKDIPGYLEQVRRLSVEALRGPLKGIFDLQGMER
jgi:alkylation response protein AidB-like acyl-CoA dehydrogenase